jgi:hypothetical protein
MNRYEEILTRMVAAHIAAGGHPTIAANCQRLRGVAEILEAHFQERSLGQLQAGMMPLPTLLRRQAE